MSESLNNLYTQARRLAVSLRDDLAHLESGEAGYGSRATPWGTPVPPTSPQSVLKGATDALYRTARSRLDELARISSLMEREWRQELVMAGSGGGGGGAATRHDPARSSATTPHTHVVWKRKVEQVVDDTRSVKASLDAYARRVAQRQAEERERSDLLRRVDVRGYADAAGKRYDVEDQTEQSVTRSKRALAEALGTGQAVLESMGATRERLKGAQKKALDVLHSLGLSDSVVRMIERRQTRDKLITYGGMGVVTVMMVWLLFRKLVG